MQQIRRRSRRRIKYNCQPSNGKRIRHKTRTCPRRKCINDVPHREATDDANDGCDGDCSSRLAEGDLLWQRSTVIKIRRVACRSEMGEQKSVRKQKQ